jgi:hypothetical protein
MTELSPTGSASRRFAQLAALPLEESKVALPLGTTGKIDKKVLRSRFA